MTRSTLTRLSARTRPSPASPIWWNWRRNGPLTRTRSTSRDSSPATPGSSPACPLETTVRTRATLGCWWDSRSWKREWMQISFIFFSSSTNVSGRLWLRGRISFWRMNEGRVWPVFLLQESRYQRSRGKLQRCKTSLSELCFCSCRTSSVWTLARYIHAMTCYLSQWHQLFLVSGALGWLLWSLPRQYKESHLYPAKGIWTGGRTKRNAGGNPTEHASGKNKPFLFWG